MQRIAMERLAERPPHPNPLPLKGYGMHTFDSLSVVGEVKNTSYQNHFVRFWPHRMAQARCLRNPLKKSLFLRCVNPLALQGERVGVRGRLRESLSCDSLHR